MKKGDRICHIFIFSFLKFLCAEYVPPRDGVKDVEVVPTQLKTSRNLGAIDHVQVLMSGQPEPC